MDAKARTVQDIFYAGTQYLVPFFQRAYSWRRSHWKRLTEDVWGLMDDQAKAQHFLGPLVCTQDKQIPGDIPSFQLIDGQQRLTTISLMLAALRDVCREQGMAKLANKIHEGYLVNEHESGLKHYKIVPRVSDRDVLIGIIEGENNRDWADFNVYKAYSFFRGQIARLAEQEPERRLQKLFSVIVGQLSLVAISIDGENPYAIFESLNTTGLRLEESDLIRNYLFMQVELEKQQYFNDTSWNSLESMFEEFGEEAARMQTVFYRNYVMLSGLYPKAQTTFMVFKEQNRHRDISLKEQVEELKRYARYQLMFWAPGTCRQAPLRKRFTQIKALDASTAHPLMMKLMDLHEKGILAEPDFCGCLDDMISFVLRRSVCGDQARQYNRWFCEAVKSIAQHPREELRQYLLKRGWPDDPTFVESMTRFPLYQSSSQKCWLVLTALEDAFGHKETVNQDSLTIEHVMPQTIGDSQWGGEWKSMLGLEEWDTVHRRWLHTIGNLTLSGYNSNLSNKGFAEKKRILADSNLQLNKAFQQCKAWNEPAIMERGEALARQCASLWPRPEGGPEYVRGKIGKRKRLSLAEARQLYLRYWTTLADNLNKRAPGGSEDCATLLDSVAIKARRHIHVRTGNHKSKCFLWINPDKRWIAAVVAPKGKRRFDRYKNLLARRNEIEAAAGEPLTWREVPGRYVHIGLWKNLTDPFNENDWPQQHAWLVDKVKCLLAAFELTGEPNKPAKGELNETQAIYLRYWTALQEVLQSSSNLAATRKPLPQHWMNMRIGRHGFWLVVAISKKRRTAHVHLGIGGKHRDECFSLLEQQRPEIEAILGPGIDWRRLSDRKQNQVQRVYENMNPTDEADWPRQHELIRQTLEAFQTAFQQRVKDLRIDGRDAEDEDNA